MKVLYIGYYRESSDWGRFAKNNILALSRAGVDVVCRPFSFSEGVTPPELQEFEAKDLQGVEYCVQHVFPEHMVGSKKFKKNVGIFANECVDFDHSSWVDKLALMDEVWSPMAREGVTFMPQAFNIEDYKKPYNAINVESINNTFRFYTFADMSTLECVIRTFHSTFDRSDAVSLMLQLDTRVQNDELHNTVDRKITEIKESMGLQPNVNLYKQDFIVPFLRDDNSKFELHSYGNCYISQNSTAVSANDFDAMMLGSTPICGVHNPTNNYLHDNMFLPINSCYIRKPKTENSLFKDMSNSKDFRITLCERELGFAMRHAFENWKKDPMADVKRRGFALGHASEFDLEAVGNKMKEQLNV